MPGICNEYNSDSELVQPVIYASFQLKKKKQVGRKSYSIYPLITMCVLVQHQGICTVYYIVYTTAFLISMNQGYLRSMISHIFMSLIAFHCQIGFPGAVFLCFC